MSANNTDVMICRITQPGYTGRFMMSKGRHRRESKNKKQETRNKTV